MTLNINNISHDNIVFCGDWHANKRWAVQAMRWAKNMYDADVILHTGDFGYHFTPSYLAALNDEAHRLGLYVLFVDGNHECGSESMRAVTQAGFKHYSELQIGEKVMSVDDDGNTIWLPIKNLIVKDYDGPLYILKAHGISGEFTPGHRIVYRKYKSGKWAESTAETFKQNTNTSIITAGSASEVDYAISDDLIKLYAWCITDAHHRDDGNWYFYQASERVSRITDILDALGYEYGISTRHRDITEIAGRRLKTKPKSETTVRMRVTDARTLPWDNNKELAPFVSQLSKRQFDLLVSEILFTDGSVSNTGCLNTGVIYSMTPTLKDAFQIQLAAHGYRTSRYEPRPGDDRLNICNRTASTLTNKGSLEVKPYAGKVWCVTVDNGRFFMEHNGSIHLTGNCFPTLYSYPVNEHGVRPLRNRIVHLPRGFRWTWDDIDYMALGGAVSIDRIIGGRIMRYPGVDWWFGEAITFDEVEYATRPGNVDVMITHDCPTGVKIPGITKESGYGWDAAMLKESEEHRDVLRTVVDAVRPKLLVHGHYHCYYESELVTPKYKTKIIGLDRDKSSEKLNMKLFKRSSIVKEREQHD